MHTLTQQEDKIYDHVEFNTSYSYAHANSFKYENIDCQKTNKIK